ALPMAVSVMRSVDLTSSSRAFIAEVRSVRSRCFRSLTVAHAHLGGLHTWARLALGTVATGVAGIGYAAGIERRRWTLRKVTLPVPAERCRSIRVLHVSAPHL